MYRYTLARLSDSKGWSTDSDLPHDHKDVTAWASVMVGKELHLSRGNYRFDYQLTQTNLEDQYAKRLSFCLSSFKPKVIATIRKVGAQRRVEVVFVETNALLGTKLVKDADEARLFVGDQLEKYMIPASETHVDDYTK